jgi:hypothetical protein
MTIDRAAADKLLTTTRSVRKRLDLTRPVPSHLIDECIEVAMQAPTGTNAQNWAFVVVTDQAKRTALADLYRQGMEVMAGSGYPPPLPEGDPREHVMPKVMDSAMYLTEILDQVPVFVIPCVQGRMEKVPMIAAQASTYGSILPAAWSSCSPPVPVAWAPRGPPSTCSSTTRRASCSASRRSGLRQRCSRWRTTRATTSSPPTACPPAG